MADAADRIRHGLGEHEEIVLTATAELRVVIRRPVLLAVTSEDLIMVFTDHLHGSGRLYRLAPVREIRSARLIGRVEPRLVVRGPRRTWRFLAPGPEGRERLLAASLSPT